MKKQTFIIIFLTIFLIPLVSADFCGNNIIEFGETCEYPSTFNNLFCSQSTTTCSGFLTGTRDAFGNCNSICGCEEDDFNFQCVKNSCGAECAVNVDCPKTNCDYLNKCYNGTYREYRSIFNTCSNSCACTHKTCEEMIGVFVYHCDEITRICYIIGGPYIEIITDNDQDGYDIECDNDCDDSDSNINPEATEICNGIDDDCDGAIDEDFDVGYSCSIGFGECMRTGNKVCSQDRLSTICDAMPGTPVIEICDNKDNDCDGLIDEGFDQDSDGIADCFDSCPNSRPEEVDQNGCDIIQFCLMQGRCGLSCDLADWKNNEEGNPRDCMTVIINREGKLYPICTGLTCAN